jgi:hypothetical protein
MPIQVKLIFTIFTVIVGIAICFINPKANNAGPTWLWSLGKNDPIRFLLFKTDGSFRKYTKLGILIFAVIFLALIWFNK